MSHPDSDIIQRPAQRNMGPGIRDPVKGSWDQRPAQRNMGPDTETHSKEHGTRRRDPLKGTWDETSRQ